MMSHQPRLKWALHIYALVSSFSLWGLSVIMCKRGWFRKNRETFLRIFSQLCLSGLIGERRANPYPGSLWLPEYQWTHLPSWQPPTPGRARRPVWETAYSYLKHIVWSLKCFSLPDHVFKTIAVETLVREGTIFEKLGVIHHRYIFVNPWPYS